jgi:hypothetical protein
MGPTDKAKASIYNFHVKGEKGICEVDISIDQDNFESSCTCRYNSGQRLCWHRYYILAGKTKRLPENELSAQAEVIEKLSATTGGRSLISRAEFTFGQKETCRRCNKSNIMDLKKGMLGKLIKVFLPRGRRYFCRSCRWSW